MTIKFYYLRDNKNIQQLSDGRYSRGNPKVCIASALDRTTNTIRYGYSVAHKQDTFTKFRAKQIASGRLASAPFEIILAHDIPCSSHEISKLIMSDLVAGEVKVESKVPITHQPTLITPVNVGGNVATGTPTTVVKLAKNWLKFSNTPRKIISASSAIPATGAYTCVPPT